MIPCSGSLLVFLILHNEKQYINASLSGIYQGLGICSVCQTPADPIGIINYPGRFNLPT